ncbi:MAG: FAD-dependent oxidoreductase [Candidatus Dormibacteria bacterium]
MNDATITVYGAPWCPDCKRTKRFLSEQRVPYDWCDIDQDADGLRYVEEAQHGGRSIPMVVFDDGSFLVEPTDEEVARKLGLTLEPQRRSYDVVIVGGGPAGLAAAIYAAREGIDAIVVERSGLGGQAGITERIDNYPGFPDGVKGAELADRFIEQARRYGVELLAAVSADSISADSSERGDIVVRLGGDQEISAHAALIATGSSYRRLGVPGEDSLIGAGVHFCATCDGPFYRGAGELMVIGGGNSAVDEGLFLRRFADRIRIVQREPELSASPLLQDKVRSDPHFAVQVNAEVTELRGDGRLESVVIKDRATNEVRTEHPRAVFVFIGLDPNTGFLRDAIELDAHGFVADRGGFRTSMDGVFVAGDVRQGSTKQLGSAVGDGIAALLAMREYLQQHHQVSPHRED